MRDTSLCLWEKESKRTKIGAKELKIVAKELKIEAKKIILRGKLNWFWWLKMNLYSGKRIENRVKRIENSGKKN